MGELVSCVSCLYFIDYGVGGRRGLYLHFLYVGVVSLNSDPFMSKIKNRTELTSSRNNLLNIIGSSDYSILASSLLNVVRFSHLIDCV
jgi:hypothetical protein